MKKRSSSAYVRTSKQPKKEILEKTLEENLDTYHKFYMPILDLESPKYSKVGEIGKNHWSKKEYREIL